MVIFINMNTKDKTLNLILRRVNPEYLENEFTECLDFESNNSSIRFRKTGSVISLEAFRSRVLSMTIDGIHNILVYTIPNDLQWYDDVYYALRKYYDERIEKKYKLLRKKYGLNESVIKILREETTQNLISECTIAAVRLNDTVILAKNRDRGYKAKVEIIHEIMDDVEVVYWRDVDTDWSEGMNEYGVGIVNSSLLVNQDEKEGKEVEKKRKQNDTTKTKRKSYDGEKIRNALSKKSLPQVIKSIVGYSGEDRKDVGLKGETFVSDSNNIYVVEMTSKHSPIIKKLKKEQKVLVRTNHGVYHKKAGYTKGEKKKSSHTRLNLAKKHLENVKTDIEVIDRLKQKYKKDPFLNPYRTKNMYHMQTTGQIMMNLSKKEVTVRMDNEMGELVGIKTKLPKNYEPKIKIRVENEKTNYKGKKLPT